MTEQLRLPLDRPQCFEIAFYADSWLDAQGVVQRRVVYAHSIDLSWLIWR